MSKQTKFLIAILIAISSITVVTALANTIYFPVIYNNYPTATPQPDLAFLDFNVSSTPDDDYVEIHNAGSYSVNLTGWWVKADSGERYDFPNGFTLDDGDTVKLRSGSGSNSSSNLYWGLDYSVWTDEGNCAYLRNPQGLEVDRLCVPDIYIVGFHPSSVPTSDYVQIKNNTSDSINMTGWRLKAESESGRYDFPDGFRLGDLASVRVRSGFGLNSATDLYIGLSYSLWTVSDNCAYLRDDDSDLIDKKCVDD
jgi:hypothetical protein